MLTFLVGLAVGAVAGIALCWLAGVVLGNDEPDYL